MWDIKGWTGIATAVLGYTLFNLAIALSGNSWANLGLMELTAAILLVLQKQVLPKKPLTWSTPNKHITAIGAISICVVIIGLEIAHSNLGNAGIVIEMIYDIVLITLSLFILNLVGPYVGLPTLPSEAKHTRLHIYMFLCVACRSVYHYRPHWNLMGLIGIAIAVVGYWSLIITFKLSALREEREAHANNVCMAGGAGILLLVMSLFHDQSISDINGYFLLGAVGIVMVFAGMVGAMKVFVPKKLGLMVNVAVYDGLLIFSPFLLLPILGGTIDMVDISITALFILISYERLKEYQNKAKEVYLGVSYE